MATKEEMLVVIEAMKAGLLNQEQIQQGMNIQKAFAEKGREAPLLTILVKKGFLHPKYPKAFQLAKRISAMTEKNIKNLIEDYTMKRRLGVGGVATVFLATDPSGKQDVALKIMHAYHNFNKLFVRRFVNEARLLKKFDNPNIVKGMQYGESNGFYYLAMEFLEGETVQDMLDRDGPLDEDKALFIIVHIAKGLDYCQKNGILHRDIKPDNVMITNEGVVKLCDLGFAKPITADGIAEEETTCGTVQYISPEQARGAGDVDIRADIYSLGATLYHMVVGEVPFSGEDSMEVMAKQVLEDLANPRSKNRTVSTHLHYFIEKMMAKERDIRYQSPEEIIEDIESQIMGKKTLTFNPGADVSRDNLFGEKKRSGKKSRISERKKASRNPSSGRLRRRRRR
jgi:serine/threonine-protein kinase